jgi:hypothetical protein
MMTRRGAALGLFWITCLLWAPAIRPQTTSGALEGVVVDMTGDPAAGVVVRVRSDSNGQVRSAVTNDNGRYRIELLLPGEWSVVAYGEDGSPSETRRVTVGLQRTVKLDLTVGSGLTEEVTVVADVPLVDPTRVHGEFRVDQEVVNSLPVVGREVASLAMLDSSVRPTPPGNFYGERDAIMVLNGQSGRANSFLVDGLDNNDRTSGTTLNSSFSQLVIKEFVVMTHQYSAEFGRAGGGVMNIITDRGSNDLQANVFAQGGAIGLSEPGEFIASLPQSDLEDKSSLFQGGFKISGPLKKDKGFYLLAYEHMSSDAVVPYTGIDRYGRPGGWMVAPQNADNVFLRTDFNLGASNFLMMRLSADSRQNEGINVGGVTTPEAGFQFDERDYQFGATLTTIVSPTKMNEVRVLAGISSFDQIANSDRPGVQRPSGIFGGNTLNQQLRDEDRIQLVDNFTWRTGDHTLKFGADVIWSKTDIDVTFNPNGSLLYETDLALEPGDCGSINVTDFTPITDPNDPDQIALREWEIRNGIYCSGDPNGVDDDGDGIIDEQAVVFTYPLVFTLIEGNPRATLDDTSVGLFVQDSWTVTPRLQIDIGLRYDLSTFVLPDDARVESTIPNGGAQRDYDNISPRFGFSYLAHPDARLVVKGGAGIFYDKLVLAFPGVASITSGTRIGMFFPQGFAAELTEDLIEEIGIDILGQALYFPDELTMRFSTGTELDTPYSVQANLGLEGVVGRRGAWNVNFLRVQGYHLALMKDLNPPAETLPGFAPEHPRDPSTGSIAALVTEGRSWYGEMTLGYRFQGKGGWFSGSYTLSRSEDMGPDPLKGGIYLPPDSDNLAGERGRSDYDRRHRLVIAGETGLGFMGLRGSAVFQLASGAPFNVTTGQDDNLDGITSDRPDGIGRNTGKNTPLSLINARRAEEGLPPYTASLDEPWLTQLDLRIWRPFLFRDGRSQSEVFFQVFNVFNTWNGGPIEGRLTSNNFGQPIGQVTLPRTVQLGVAFSF